MNELPFNLNLDQVVNFLSSPSLQSLSFIFILYFALLWMAIIIWVTRDAISRTNSIILQVLAILLNVFFPILGILLYLIIRPSKTKLDRYYEDLEHKLILNSIDQNKKHSLDSSKDKDKIKDSLGVKKTKIKTKSKKA